MCIVWQHVDVLGGSTQVCSLTSFIAIFSPQCIHSLHPVLGLDHMWYSLSTLRKQAPRNKSVSSHCYLFIYFFAYLKKKTAHRGKKNSFTTTVPRPNKIELFQLLPVGKQPEHSTTGGHLTNTSMKCQSKRTFMSLPRWS